MPRPPESSAKGCPYCGHPTHPDFAPFCSRGCKDRDLLKWLGDGYRIAGAPADEADLAGVDSTGDDS
jgi:endogenous inhibitor of DNA gyrase (YacG/DUF329 family)